MVQVADASPAIRKRAYQLARSGICKHLIEIRRRLKSEGYSATMIEEYLEKETVRADLERICSHVERM